MRVVAGIEVTVTNSDTEALLLEHNLIKSHRPRFNVILRDDKSFPYVHLSAHEFPRLSFYRGTRKLARPPVRAVPVGERRARDAEPAAQAVPAATAARTRFFANRSRPCLEYQIGRCSGALHGPDRRATPMRGTSSRPRWCSTGARRTSPRASAATWTGRRSALDFERAAMLRDQLAALTDDAGTPGRDARAGRRRTPT